MKRRKFDPETKVSIVFEGLKRDKKIQDVYVVNSSGFNINDKIMKFSNIFFKLLKAVKIHIKFSISNEVNVIINNRIIKRIFGDININEVVKFFVNHFLPLRLSLE